MTTYVLVAVPMPLHQARVYRLLSQGIAYTDTDGSYSLKLPLSEYRKWRERLSDGKHLECIKQRSYSGQMQAPKFRAVSIGGIKLEIAA